MSNLEIFGQLKDSLFYTLTNEWLKLFEINHNRAKILSRNILQTISNKGPISNSANPTEVKFYSPNTTVLRKDTIFTIFNFTNNKFLKQKKQFFIPQSEKLFAQCANQNKVSIYQFELLNQSKLAFTVDTAFQEFQTSSDPIIKWTLYIFDVERNEIINRINAYKHITGSPLNFTLINSKLRILLYNYSGVISIVDAVNKTKSQSGDSVILKNLIESNYESLESDMFNLQNW